MRVVEATIAILLILGAIIVISPRKATGDGVDFNEILPPLLEELSQNLTLRVEIVRNSAEESLESRIENSLSLRINNPSLNYSVEICDLTEPCALDPYPLDFEQDIFSSERVIGASIPETDFTPRKVKIFLWQKTN